MARMILVIETGLDSCEEVATKRVMVCGDTRAVHKAIREVEARDDEWSVWEIVDGKTCQRSVIFQMDGNQSYDVVLS